MAADPARAPAAFQPGGFAGLVYFRLHGSPRMYYSANCIFDNTAAAAANANALALANLLSAFRRKLER